ncbi:serine/threonine-protein kinase HipA [Paenarthrobacter nicotinovorans]|uniref:Serine/threonine-protein kinase HipA n=1 Tax=Paenarthrobacter nicotinovorans TaxID=29320 RepID=A0ABT9TSM6_PAENI|nr:type II toxin-antitoxin system HipA family toxin [Paenarthrobacter nicotinovorans]MDQ0104686.1 serine/threonine-protein kinase HipA [Paenarthrobacter nicotinovorans]
MRGPIDVDLQTPRGAVHVGRAFVSARRGATTTSFDYDVGFLGRPDSYAIDPALPIARGTHSVRGLPGAFADASPDRWGRHIVAKRLQAESRQLGKNPGTLTDSDFLLGVSDLTRQGALQFRIGDGPHLSNGTDVPKLVQLPQLRQAAHDVEVDPDNLGALKRLLDAGTGSLGGARPKASVQDGDKLAIAKFSHQGDQWRVIAWEAATIVLASAAGIETPGHHLEHLGSSDPVLLLDRFDRDGQQRIGYVSAMTMLSEQDGAHGDYLDLLDVIDENSENPSADREELFRRIAFNIVVNNTDDHLRNHGFLRGRSGWRLAPAFDVNPNPDVYGEHATSIDGATRREDAMQALLGVSEYFVDADKRDEILDAIHRSVATWQDAADACRIPAVEIELFAPLFSTLPRC